MPDRVRLSRMELRLGAQISAARSLTEADCRRAELAAYLARLGRFDEARVALDYLRQNAHRQPRAELSAWIHLAEGLFAYFSNVGLSQADGVQRAYALCSAVGLDELRATCAAWLAQWAYVRVDMTALANHVREALQLATPTNHSARSRASLVAAQALHLAARPDLALWWYRRARDHAIAEHDDVTVSALMHNMAWIRMLLLRQAILSGRGETSAGRHALMNAESTTHFDQMLGDSSWQELKPILRAQILSLQGEASQGLALYEEHLIELTSAARLQANLLADKGWCHVQLGQLDAGRNCAAQALLSLEHATDADDRAAAHGRLAQIFFALGEVGKATSHTDMASTAWAIHEAVQASALRLLSSLDEYGRATPKTPPYSTSVDTRPEPDQPP